MKEFNFKQAFDRNLGWVTENEQKKLREITVAIPGLGGVGGHHLHALIRLGISKFKISDPDHFEIGNFNRQFGATLSNVNKSKVDVIKEMALDINPECEITVYPEGINHENMDDFLSGVDIICDGLDLYASSLRAPLYELAHKKGIYVISAGPFGMGSSIIAFHPKKMSFNEYFDFNQKNLSEEALIIRFLAGMSPTIMHRKYIAEGQRFDLFGGNLPSLHVGCYSASSLLSTTVIKIALGRGKVHYAPKTLHYDFYLNKMRKTWRPFGNRNILQRILIRVLHKMFKVREFN